MGLFLRHHTRSVALSIVFHVSILAGLLLGVRLGPGRTAPPAGQVIEAVMLDQTLVDREIERQRRQAEAEAQARAREQREADARRRAEEQAAREQVAREQAERVERERQVAIEAERQREAAELLARQEAERLEQERQAELRRQAEEDERRERERLAEERRQREEEERRRREAEEARLQAELESQLQAELAVEAELREARNSGELDRYLRQIQSRIESNWIPPASAVQGLECVVNVTQIPSGDVVGVRVGRCNGDAAVVRSIEAAVLRSSPLPTPSRQVLFDRNIEVTFRPEF